MIGKKIEGTDLLGNKCSGIILDKLLCLQTITMKQPGVLSGQGQTMPIPLDAYLVYDPVKETLHQVPPGMISKIDYDVVSITKDELMEFQELKIKASAINSWMTAIR